MTMFNMQLGEVAPGGTGSGLYGMLILAVITVFVAGLMVGRTPEYLGKKITPREIKLAASYFLVTPLIVLTGTAMAMAMPGQRAGMLNTGPHGLSEVLYAFTSAANNNGSAFAGISRQHRVVQHRSRAWRWCSAGSCRSSWCSRWPARWPSRARRRHRSARCPPTDRSSSAWSSASPLILVALTFLPMLALGPLAEGIH